VPRPAAVHQSLDMAGYPWWRRSQKGGCRPHRCHLRTRGTPRYERACGACRRTGLLAFTFSQKPTAFSAGTSAASSGQFYRSLSDAVISTVPSFSRTLIVHSEAILFDQSRVRTSLRRGCSGTARPLPAYGDLPARCLEFHLDRSPESHIGRSSKIGPGCYSSQGGAKANRAAKGNVPKAAAGASS
jgi:hypothetical protein